jgi:RNA methyltransferase, TrmH family
LIDFRRNSEHILSFDRGAAVGYKGGYIEGQMQMITSLQNERVKLAHALQTQPKTRRKEGKIALEGTRLVQDAYQNGGHRPEFVLYEPEHADRGLIDLLERQRVQLYPISAEVMRHLSATEQPQGIVAIFPMPEMPLPSQPARILVLDDIRDPGNLGTILRTAAAAGVEAVLLSPGCVDAYNPKVLRSGVGAHYRVAIAELGWTAIKDACRHTTVYLADMEGDVTYDAANWSAPWTLIIGSEAHGSSEEAVRMATQRVYIPMVENAESLNAAIAAAVILYEAYKARR